MGIEKKLSRNIVARNSVSMATFVIFQLNLQQYLETDEEGYKPDFAGTDR